MSASDKAKAISLYLDPIADCKSYTANAIAETTFEFTLGNSEGSYMQIGGYEFRCLTEDPSIYRNAVALWLTLA